MEDYYLGALDDHMDTTTIVGAERPFTVLDDRCLGVLDDQFLGILDDHCLKALDSQS